MKYAVIAVLYRTPKKEIERFKKEIESLGFADFKIFFGDNTHRNIGYAAGINKAIMKAKKYNPDVYIFANTDISLKELSEKNFKQASLHFDLWGFVMKQHGKTYYTGRLDKWRMSAGLSQKKPPKRFIDSEFVPGALLCAKKEVVEIVGDWDDRFFLYYEDVDYCLRAKKAGFKVGVDTMSAYEHYEKSSSDPQKNKHLLISRIKFLLKHGSLAQKFYELIRFPKTLIEERPFVTNFLILNASSFVNKLLNFVLFIFLVKYLPVKNYGLYTLTWAHVALLQPFLDFGTTSYGLVYMNAKDPYKVNSLFSLRIVLACVIFLTTNILAYVFGYSESVLLFIFLTSFTLFSNALSGSLLIYSSLKEKLMLPSVLSIGFNTLLISTLAISLVTGGGLSVIFTIVFAFYNIYSLVNFFVLKKEVRQLVFTVNVSHWMRILKKSATFLLISLFAGIYFKLDVFLLNFLKGPEEVGIYSSGFKFLEAFLFIVASYNIISTPMMARLRRQSLSNLKLKIRKDIFYLSLIGIIIPIFVFFLSPYLLDLIFKKDYADAVPVLRIVIWAFPLILITSVFFNGLYVLGRANVVMWLFIMQALLNVTLNVVFIPQYSYISSSYITILGETINSLVAFIFLQKTLKV